MIKSLLLLVIPGIGGERVSDVVPFRHVAYLKGQGEGHGPKLFRIICKEYPYNDKDTCSTHPHNFYLQLLAETGVIGFLFIIISFMYILKEAFLVILKQKKISGQEACLLGCFFLTLWPLTPNGNFFNNWLMIVYILPLGFYLNLKIYNKVYNNIS